MREIKFRGRNARHGWLTGHYFVNRGVHFIVEDGIANPLNTWEDYAVDPGTVGQYTGLKDRNGKEIYEGDILVQEIQDNIGLFKDYFEARWEDAGFLAMCLNNESKGLTDALESCTDYLICGNRWDNPELLEDGK